MRREVVIGDVHARPGAVRGLLRELGATDRHGRRKKGWWIVQVGDLLDRKASKAANLKTARLAVDLFDVVVCGNHELDLLDSAALKHLRKQGWPQAATACGDWLITHAGVHPQLAQDLPKDAAKAAKVINRHWERQRDDPLVAGKRSVMRLRRWPGERCAQWPQIIGHVPQRRPCPLPGDRFAIDVGADGRIGAVVRDGKGRWTPVTFDVSRGALVS